VKYWLLRGSNPLQFEPQEKAKVGIGDSCHGEMAMSRRTHMERKLVHKPELEQVFSRIDRDKFKHLARLRRLLKQPSVSQTGFGIKECADLLGKMYREVGCEKVEVIKTKGSPIVYGECKGDSDTTLLVYMMYDTQPYNEPGWKHPPMGAKIVGMKLPSGNVKAMVNRGACNQKGPLVAILNAVDACCKEIGRPPVNLMLVAEGEEELGSPSLKTYLRKDKKRLSRADACYFPGFTQDGSGACNLYLGAKGAVCFEMNCSGKRWGRGPQESAIHSGLKPMVDSPAWRLVDALATMSEENGGRVLIDGFYDDVRPLSEEDKELVKDMAKRFDLEGLKKIMGIKQLMLPDNEKERLLQQFVAGTTLNIIGIWGGYIEEGAKTVLPHEASCKFDIRLVPDQKKENMLPLVREHLRKHGYSDISVKELLTSEDCYRTSVKVPIAQAVIRSCGEFGHDPIIWPSCPAVAPFSVFDRALKLPPVIGMIGHGELAHAPNEYIVIEGNKKIASFIDTEKFAVTLMDEFATAR
jgi:acetylornithine deacetylase/succinyl-diaminopimelate desuccinylase-like protein